MFKKLALMMCTSLIFITGCGKTDAGTKESSQSTSDSTVQKETKDYNIEQLKMPKKGEEIAVMETSMGTIKIRLFPKLAPKAVENFIGLSKTGKYDDVIFHRVINDFMIQGGDPDGTGMGGESIWGEPFEDEFTPELHNFRGALSMANSGANSNGSQFFIVQAKEAQNLTAYEEMNKEYKGLFEPDVIEAYKDLGGTPHLDYVHTVFGQVFEGMDIVDSIAAVETGENDKPKEDVTIKKIDIVKYNE